MSGGRSSRATPASATPAAATAAAAPAPAADDTSAAPADADADAQIEPVTIVRVKALQDHRRRAGRAFTREATDIPVTELSEDEFEQLQGDALLSVAIIESGDSES